MEYTQLGQSSLVISRLGFGCEQLGGTDWGRVDDNEIVKAVQRAMDSGITFFDTADVYGLGRSEELLSNALGSARTKVIIATKFGVSWHKIPGAKRARTYVDCSPQRVGQALDASLRRLRIDCIPLYQIHKPDQNVRIEDTLETLQKCQQEGKIRYYGCSNFPSNELLQANRVMQVNSAQIPFSLLDPIPGQEMCALCHQLQIGVLAYGSLGHGLLTGKYGPDAKFTHDDRRSRLPSFLGETFRLNLKVVEKLRLIGEQYGRTVAQVAVRCVLDEPGVSCCIVGVKNIQQLEENLGIVGWHLASEDRRFLAREKGQRTVGFQETGQAAAPN